MKWLDNMVLQTKLMLLTSIMVIAMIILGILGFKATAGWENDIIEITDVSMPSVINVGTIRNGTQLVAIQQNRARGLDGDSKMQTKMVDVADKMDDGFERIDKGIKAYETLERSDDELKIWNGIQDDYKKWREISNKLKITIVTLSKTYNPAEIETLFKQMGDQIDDMRAYRNNFMNGLQDIYDLNKKEIDDISITAKETSGNYKQLFLTVAIVSILFAIILAWALIRSITRAITASVTSIRDGAMQITSASDQVASSSSSLAQGASEQASSVEEVSATLEESTAINTQNTDNARQADILARNANDSAKAGYEKGEQLSHSMHAITESAAKISGIIKTIDQIAFQTNLLALNAAVEAARAGEHGLGFAVVADEVRNLAQRAASAAKETSDIIEEVVGQIKEGNQIALATHTSFQEIVEQSKKVSDLIGEIAIAGKRR